MWQCSKSQHVIKMHPDWNMNAIKTLELKRTVAKLVEI